MSFIAYKQMYRVQVADRVYDQEGLEVDFKIVYDDKSKTNTSKIVLWNLAPATLEKLDEGVPIVLSGGWPGSMGIIFSGTILRVNTEATKNKDTPTEIYVAQDKKLWFKSTVNKEWKGPVKATDIVRDLVNSSGFTIGFIDPSIDVVYKRNWSYNGALKDALIEIAEDCGARSYNEDGKIFFMLPGRSVIQQIEVAKEHILESPKKTKKGNWKFTTILRWEARPGTVVTLQSKYIQGKFTTLNVTHERSGDKKFITAWEVSDGSSKQSEQSEQSEWQQ